MRKIIILESRDGTNNYLKRFSDKNKTYLLKTEFDTITITKGENEILSVDPSGGPVLAKGMCLNGYTIKSIDHVKGLGFTITFE